MPKWLRSAVIFVLAALMLLGLILPAFAAEETEQPFTSIHTVEDLQKIRENPSGNYLLEEDLDLAGVEWQPVDFTGVFDGGGHALLNLKLSSLGDAREEVYTERKQSYQAGFAGFFSTLKNAQVRNLQLINVRGVVETDEPCFVGGITGFSYESRIQNCYVTGTMELRAHKQMYGIGGLVGYGSGIVEGCNADVALICVDTDEEKTDEQFLGGILGTGFMDLIHNTVEVEGSVAIHGASHNGTLVGRMIKNPLGEGKVLTVTHNNSDGHIKFYENNGSHNAVCNAGIGEFMVKGYVMHHNMNGIDREPVSKYELALGPCVCEGFDLHEYTVYPMCSKKRFGHHVTECYGCGYMDKDDYKLYTHTVSNWTVLEEATLEKEGLSEGACDNCGLMQTRVDPVLVPEETQPPVVVPVATEPVPAMTQQEEAALRSKIGILITVLAIAVALLLGVAGFLVYALLKDKKQQKPEAETEESEDPEDTEETEE